MKQLWAPWRMNYVSGDEPAIEGCVLCHIGNGVDDTANLVVERTEHTFTVLNRYPYTSGHVMVVPNIHVTSITELDAVTSGALLQGAARAITALGAAMHPDGFNVGINLGEAAGASLDHVHVHVVPRWGGDTNFMPVLGDVKVLPQQLEATAESLRAEYAPDGAR